MRLRLCLAVTLVTLTACGGRAGIDDGGFHAAVAGSRSGAEVTFDGILLSDPEQVGTHEHLLLRASTGEQVEVDHNTSLAPRVPARRGDRLTVHGNLYVDPGPRIGVHCTHSRTSRGCPVPGWVELAGNYYE